MKDEKILQDEVLDDEELENVVGGSILNNRRTWYRSANNNANLQNSAQTNTNYELPHPKGLFNLFLKSQQRNFRKK